MGMEDVLGMLVVGGLALVMSVLMGLAAWMCWRRMRLVARAIAVALRQAVSLPGRLVKVKGTAQAGRGGPLRGPGSKKPCAYYDYKVEHEHIEGRSGGRTRTRRETVEHEQSVQPFFVTDGEGSLKIEPVSAYFGSIERSYSHVDPNWLGATIYTTEQQIPIDGPLYAVGTVAENGDGSVALEKGDAEVIVSTRSFASMTTRYIIGGIVAGVLSLAAFAGMVIVVYGVLFSDLRFSS